MRVAFVCDDTTKYGDANLSLYYNLAKYINLQGGEACIIGHCENASDMLEETVEGVKNYRFCYPINRINNEIFAAFEKDRSYLQLGLRLLKHPLVAFTVFARVVMGRFPIEKRYIQLIERLHREKPFDAVVACGGVFQPIHALAKCRINCKRIGYMLDPHWKHKDQKWYYKREELFAWEKLDRIVVPKLLAQEYTDAEFQPYREKLIAAEFPGIAGHSTAETEVSLDVGKVNLVFAGNFYANIRNPKYLFDLMDQMQDHVCLHILGGCYGYSEALSASMQRLTAEGKVKFHGMLPVSEARTVMQQADILVNIGNSIENMLPSKIFEYFSTGKPVVHIQKIEKDPCLPYLETYQNGLVLPEWDAVLENAGKLEYFCGREQNTIPFETVASRFEACTIPYVANQLLNGEKR